MKQNVALLCDLREERWVSMDLVADMFERYLPLTGGVDVTAIRPRYRALGFFGQTPNGRKLERLVNRFGTYPPFVRPLRNRFDLFHIVDHSYAHLANSLDPQRAIVQCHDLDAFRCLVDPAREPRPAWFRRLSSTVLRGLQSAAHVICCSECTRRELAHYNLVRAEKTSVVHYGVHPDYLRSFGPAAEEQARALIGRHVTRYVINVGSNVARKRLDVLLEIFKEARKHEPDLHLVRVGGDFTDAQQSLAIRLGVAAAITSLTAVPTAVMGALYRGAFAAIQPSSYEGFGLPIIEAMACGCPVLATDMPIFREVGGDAALLCSGEPAAWAAQLQQFTTNPVREYFAARGLQRARSFTWESTARQVVDIYNRTALTYSAAQL